MKQIVFFMIFCASVVSAGVFADEPINTFSIEVSDNISVLLYEGDPAISENMTVCRWPMREGQFCRSEEITWKAGIFALPEDIFFIGTAPESEVLHYEIKQSAEDYGWEYGELFDGFRLTTSFSLDVVDENPIVSVLGLPPEQMNVCRYVDGGERCARETVAWSNRQFAVEENVFFLGEGVTRYTVNPAAEEIGWYAAPDGFKKTETTSVWNVNFPVVFTPEVVPVTPIPLPTALPTETPIPLPTPTPRPIP